MKALRGKIVQAAKRRDETLRRQFVHVQTLRHFPAARRRSARLASSRS